MSESAERVIVQLAELRPRHPAPLRVLLATYSAGLGVATWSAFYGSIQDYVYAAASVGFALIALTANRLNVFFAGLEFRRVMAIQRVFSLAYYTSSLLLIILVFAASSFRPPYGPYLHFGQVFVWAPILFLMGIAFFTVGLSINWFQILDSDSEGKLSLTYFLKNESDLEYSWWLSHGLELTQKKMAREGLRLDRGTLLLGAEFAKVDRSLRRADIECIADWLGGEGERDFPDPLGFLVLCAKRGSLLGFHNRRDWIDYLFGNRGFMQIAVGVIGFIAGLLTIFFYAHSLGWL